MHQSAVPIRPRSAFRLVVLATVLLSIAALVATSLGVPSEATGRHRPFPLDLQRAGIPQLREALAARRITSEELVQAYLERIRTLNTNGPGLNAVRVVTRDAVAQAKQADQERRKGGAKGPMHGIPVLIKDNIDLSGLPTTAGAMALEKSYPAKDAFLVTRLKAAGAIILGKTNLTEFANFTTNGMPSGYSGLGGQVLNPYDVSQTPSGSSSGSGSAAAAALATVTIGTETSGSILSPSAANSLVGVKPTVGLVSRTGVVPIAASQDTAGPMTRTVYDAAALLSALTGIDPEDPATETSSGVVGTDYTRTLSTTALQGKRIGVASSPTGNQGVLFSEALDVLRAQGATVVPVTVTTGGLPPSILSYEFKRDLNAYLARLPRSAPMDTLDDVVKWNLAHVDEGTIKFGQTQLVASNEVDLADPVAKAAYETNRDTGIAGARERIDSVLAAENLDAIVFVGSGSAGIGARAQYPSVAVPIGYDPANGRPVGMSFLGTAYTEAQLLALAYDYEQASRKWRPPSQVNPSLFRCADFGDRDRSCAP
ncbi:amidase family protein [Plantactinospora sp. KLBMP9567]|uniref:amidase family protein n=1 Tax=Plantactinospora sp. KLBMP9567 TaxID=3085900 RepID=UPI002981F28B|nr:amidase family protein [Plantactinospora sp. KLBMP9567]MDW5323505.1 amidase family protein [Plantactinospora sp. KLBMP9567]